MSEQDSKKIQSLKQQGMISDEYADFLSKNTESASMAASALLASVEAREYALETGIPLIVAEAGVLYEVHQDGSKKFVKDLPKPSKNLPKKFKLK